MESRNTNYHLRFNDILDANGFLISPEVRFPDGKPSPRAWLLARMRSSLASKHWHDSGGNKCRIGICAVDHAPPLVSALTVCRDNDYLIGIHAPVFAATFQLLSEIVCHLHNEPVPTWNQEILLADAQDTGTTKIKAVDAGIPTGLPQSEASLRLAGFLQRLAIEFIYYHELSHIVLGHSARKAKDNVSAVLAEPSLRLLDRNSEERAMEYFADYSASASIALCCLENSFILTPTNLLTLEDRGHRYYKYAMISLFAVYLFFEAQERKYSMREDAYPSVMARMVTSLRAFEDTLLSANAISRQDFQLLWEDSIKDISLGLHRAGYPNPFIKGLGTLEQIKTIFAEVDMLAAQAESFRATWSNHLVSFDPA